MAIQVIGNPTAANIGTKSDTAATWYTSVSSLISLIKLSIAGIIGAGSHAFTYNSDGTLATDAWTLLGTLRTKTYTYSSGQLTAESDWV